MSFSLALSLPRDRELHSQHKLGTASTAAVTVIEIVVCASPSPSLCLWLCLCRRFSSCSCDRSCLCHSSLNTWASGKCAKKRATHSRSSNRCRQREQRNAVSNQGAHAAQHLSLSLSLSLSELSLLELLELSLDDSALLFSGRDSERQNWTRVALFLLSHLLLLQLFLRSDRIRRSFLRARQSAGCFIRV